MFPREGWVVLALIVITFNFLRYMTFSKRLVYNCLLFICVFDFLRNLNWFFVSKFSWKVKYYYSQPTRLQKNVSGSCLINPILWQPNICKSVVQCFTGSESSNDDCNNNADNLWIKASPSSNEWGKEKHFKGNNGDKKWTLCKPDLFCHFQRLSANNC